MTRDFNKPRRDDERPFSRPQPQPSDRQGDERTPRPDRPRLNRETVDRAWESGAPTQHADYRTRSSNGQPPRNSWRNNQQSEHSSAQNGRKPFGPRPDVDGNRRFDRPSGGGNQDNRSRSFDTDRNPNQFGERRTNNYQGNTGNSNRYGARPDNGNAPRRPYEPNRPNSPYGSSRPSRPYGQHNPNSQPNSRPPFRKQGAERDYPRRNFDRDQRSGPPQTGERPARSFDRDSRPPRDFDRGNRPPHRFERDSRPSYNGQQRDTQNPRWQSRPAVQRDLSIREQPSSEVAQEHFEGDYERFNKPARPEYQRRQPRKEYRRPTAPGRPFQGKQTTDTPSLRPEEEERHVTRLPDGRVLKGPRPVQRKNAQFWTEIGKEAESLVEHVEVPTAPAETETVAAETEEHSVNAHPEADLVGLEQTVAPTDGEEAPTAKRKPRKGPASSTREKKPKVKAATPKGPKPSQRGHKWPTP